MCARVGRTMIIKATDKIGGLFDIRSTSLKIDSLR